MSLYEDMEPIDKTLMDVVSIGTAVATLTNLLPAVAAILTIVWTGIRIFETPTCQSLLGKKKNGQSPNAD